MNIFGIWAFDPTRSSNYLVRLELSKGSSGRGTLRPWPLLFAALQIPILPSFPSICNPLNLNVHFCLFIVVDVFCCPFILVRSCLFLFTCHNHFLFAAPCILLAILVFIFVHYPPSWNNNNHLYHFRNFSGMKIKMLFLSNAKGGMVTHTQ